MILSLLTKFAVAGDACSFDKGVSNLLGFPTWYQYLPGQQEPVDINSSSSPLMCAPQLGSLSDIWLIIAAIIEIILRIAVFAAVGYVIYGGVLYSLSQGEPEKTKQARHTIINALIGLSVAVLSATVVNFLAGSIPNA